MGRSRASKKGSNTVNRNKSTRHVLPLDAEWWGCLYEDGTITIAAFITDYQGHWVNLSAWNADDHGYERWTEYPTRGAAEEAYQVAVDTVTNAPNPLPLAWLRSNKLKQR